MVKKIVIIPPQYCFEFEPWVSTIRPDYIITGEQAVIPVKDIVIGFDLFRGLWKRINRAALWFPLLFNKTLSRGVLHIYVIGEPSYLSNILAWLLLQKNRNNKYYVRFAQNKLNKLPFPFGLIEKYSIYRAHNLFCVAPPSKAILGKKYPDSLHKAVFLHNPIPQEFYDNEFLERYRKVPCIFYVGLFEEHKGVHDFIRLTEVFPNYQFVAVGSGKLESDLIDSGVQVYSKMDRIRLITLMRDATVIVVPSKNYRRKLKFGIGHVSWSEQFGRVIPEAQALGIPVIGCRTGGIEYTLGIPELLYEEDSFGELVGKVNQLINDQQFYNEMQRKGILNARRFNMEAFRNLLHEL